MYFPQSSERNDQLNKAYKRKKVQLRMNVPDKFVEIFDFDENVGEKAEFQQLCRSSYFPSLLGTTTISILKA